MPSDVQLSARARKIAIACRLDVSRVRIRVARGALHLQGTVSRMGEDAKNPEENSSYLEKLDDQLRALPGSRGVHYAFDNWRREPTGIWRFTGRKSKGARK